MKNRYKQAIDNNKRRPLSVQMRHRLREGLFLVFVACAIFLFISLVTYHANDPGWSSTGLGKKVANWGGRVGAWFADIFLSLFGIVAFLFPFLIVLSSWLNLQEREDTPKKSREWIFKAIGWIFLITSCCGLVNFYLQAKSHLPADSGGIIGDLLGSGLSLLFNKTGSSLLFITTLLCGVTLVTGLSWLAVVELIGEGASKCWVYLRAKRKTLVVKPTTKIEPAIEKPKRPVREEPVAVECVTPPPLPPKPVVAARVEPPREKKKVDVDPGVKLAPGTLPPLNLLNAPPTMSEKPFANISFEELSLLVEQRLSDFGVEVKVVAVHPGPVITRFELDLAPGIKVSKITGLAKDIARSLSAVSVRVVLLRVRMQQDF